MNLFAEVEQRIRGALEALQAEGQLPADLPVGPVELQEARDPAHGDIASNVAMLLAKAARMQPRSIAELIAGKLGGDPAFARVEVAGPGFLNLTMAADAWRRLVTTILDQGPGYGGSAIGQGQRVDVEYVSANPTGPMHVGHCRGAVFGDALCNLLAFAGYEVTREYYVNDAGAQVDKLGRSTYLRYREALGEDIGGIPAGLYPGDYLKPIGARLAEVHGRALLDMAEPEWLPIARGAAVSELLAQIKDDLAALDIHHDCFFSERSLTEGGRDQVREAIELLRAKGLIFEGRLPRPKGHDEDEWEDREQTLFRSTAFGDDVDRALMKSDGSYTYFAYDVAYHHNKLERGFDHYFNVLGADHVGYIPRLKAAVAALSDGKASFSTPVCQLVKVLRHGEPVRMSKRAGTFVALRDVVDEVGSDPVRFMMLMRKNDSPLDFDLAKVVEQSKDNPVFYVQYAHARAASVFRNAREPFPELDKAAIRSADLRRLDDPGEIDIIKRLARYPRVLESAAREREPHRLPFYLFDLASAFHQQWTRGNESPHLRFIQPDDPGATAARLALVAAMQQVIASGLSVLGVHAPEEMR
ncbi:MAG: arginine--tRNA ligase [Hyphomicrobiaceae bacterium]|nr:arginine--tRNA ligase [Hyphomicrobiaceae bacterium]